MLKRWITGAFAVGLLTGTLALAACGSEHVTRTTTTEQTTTAPVMEAVPPAQSTTTTTTVHGVQ